MDARYSMRGAQVALGPASVRQLAGASGRGAPLLATTGAFVLHLANRTVGLAHGESSW